MDNTFKDATKVDFIGANSEGYITTTHTKSGKDVWKILNGDPKDTVSKTVTRNIDGL